MRRLLPLTVLAIALAAAVPPAARAAGPAYVPGEVVVRYARAHAAAAAPGEEAVARVVRLRRGQSVAAGVRRLRARPGVLSATPNYIARASAFVPDDPGRGAAGGWEALQWNFLPFTGVDAPDAWQHLIDAGRPGGKGVVVAVLDTGIAYSDHGRFLRSPDFSSIRFVHGHDFVDHDAYPNDENGHGTHVAGTIAEGTGNGVAVTGLAYGAKLMPVRVLDRDGVGDTMPIAKGIRWAADHGAQVINLSFEFPPDITRWQIPEILDALRYAHHKGALVVGAAGNAAAQAVAYPARSSDVLSVGATTEHGCLAAYSDRGQDLDMVAPGGGKDADLGSDPACEPAHRGGDIYQMTFRGISPRRFGLPAGYVGTSMAAPHVSAAAALVIASGVLGPHPSPAAITRRLEATARDLGSPGRDGHYGYGLLDAGKATDPAVPVT
jgi:serine protease